MASTRSSIGLALALSVAACGLEPPSEPAPSTPEPVPVPDAPVPEPTPTPSPSPSPTASPTPDPTQPQPQQPPPQPATPPPLPSPFPGYELAWSDEFDGATVDPTKWRSWDGSRRDAVNTIDALTVSDGELHIRTYTESGVHKTGLLGTDGRFEATNGYFEARIRFHGAPGHWCAFWLISPTIGAPKGDPGTAGAEIDVVEHRLVDGGGWDLRDHVAMSLNWDGYGADRKNAQKVTMLPGSAAVDGAWHVYAVLWTDADYTFYVDGVPLWKTDAAVSRRSEWLHLSCEVDDSSWAGSIPPGGYGTRETSTTGMDVDWVRAWQVKP
jgi:beta-glucanase (GH16 family)